MNRKTRLALMSRLLVGICLFGFGCRPSLDDLTVWKAEVRSPDGLWIARARTIQNGGFGSASIDTYVELTQPNTSRPPTTAVYFSCQGPVPRPYVLDNIANAGGTVDLKMNWIGPTHLAVTYDGRKVFSSQIVEIPGVDVSVQDLSGSRPTAEIPSNPTMR